MKTRATRQHNTCDEKRRSFLKLSGLLGLGVAAAVLPTEQAQAVLFGKREYKVSKTRLAMGTFVAMTAIHPSRDEAENAMGLAFAEIHRLSRLLSRHSADSPVSLLNSTGSLAHAQPEILELVARSLAYHKQSGGAFDITVQPLVDLFRERGDAGKKPSESEISAILPRTGSQHIRSANGHLSFAREGMGITLDGIAKGYIVDRASQVLRQHGIVNHLINAGGDIRTSGSAVRGKAWTVAIQDPAKGKAYPDIVTMRDGAMATSGNYEIYYDREKMFHHIVDSRTGHSPALTTSVTVTAASVMAADALATSVFVMPPAQGLAFINSQPGCECFLLGKDGSTRHSSGWNPMGTRA